MSRPIVYHPEPIPWTLASIPLLVPRHRRWWKGRDFDFFIYCCLAFVSPCLAELGGLCFRLLAGLVSQRTGRTLLPLVSWTCIALILSAMFETLYYAGVLPYGFIYKAGPRAFCLKRSRRVKRHLWRYPSSRIDMNKCSALFCLMSIGHPTPLSEAGQRGRLLEYYYVLPCSAS
jgi:hypothetical protein